MRDLFSDTPLLNPFALLDGEQVHASEADPGVRSGYICVGCGSPLILKASNRNRSFFSHLGETKCAGGLETALHREAKAVFARYASLRVPACEVPHRGRSIHICEAGVVHYHDVLTETRTSKIRPDVSLLRHDKDPFLVEIVVSHRTDYRKRQRLRELDYPCLEIKVSGLLNGERFDRELLERTLIDDDSDRYKRWVHVPRQDGYEAQIEANIAREERERQNRLEWEYEDIDRCAQQKNREHRMRHRGN